MVSGLEMKDCDRSLRFRIQVIGFRVKGIGCKV
jgi:hypothetical protein